jgi:hypothetical protein
LHVETDPGLQKLLRGRSQGQITPSQQETLQSLTSRKSAQTSSSVLELGVGTHLEMKEGTRLSSDSQHQIDRAEGVCSQSTHLENKEHSLFSYLSSMLYALSLKEFKES